MDIHNNTTNLRFETGVEGEEAYLEYRLHDGKIMLMHTWVPAPLEGRGIAGALATFAFDHAKAEGLPVVVYCPYVKAWLERHPERKEQVVPGA
ncbi:MAG: N-acetyltransferase [Chitinophagaceae bacterium]|nr:MAG: N-acetyltransferase [Chitinophagaceae bacterium]